jgi:hypothetical protein
LGIETAGLCRGNQAKPLITRRKLALDPDISTQVGNPTRHERSRLLGHGEGAPQGDVRRVSAEGR